MCARRKNADCAVVCLTGGVGSGKSTVMRWFQHRGVPVLDADHVARKLLQSRDVMLFLRQQYDHQIFSPAGLLNRQTLRTVLLQDPLKRKGFEVFFHPLVRAQLLVRLKKLDAIYSLIELPLLPNHAFWRQRADRVIVVCADEQVRRQRCRSRVGYTDQIIDQIMAVQPTAGAYRALAQDVVFNNGSVCDLYQQLDPLHGYYSSLFA